MKKKSALFLSLSLAVFVAFVIYTICVKFVDVAKIGPNGSSVGFSTMNGAVHDAVGVNWLFYHITDLVGGAVLLIGVFFAVVGIVQWAKRKSLRKVDNNILALGIFYIATVFVFVFFEICVVNRRPVIIDNVLEASYPSSTSLLSLTFLLSLFLQIDIYIKNKTARIFCKVATVLLCIFLVVGRVISGVHWCSDILGGIIIGTALVLLYYGIYYMFKAFEEKKCKTEISENEK